MWQVAQYAHKKQIINPVDVYMMPNVCFFGFVQMSLRLIWATPIVHGTFDAIAAIQDEHKNVARGQRKLFYSSRHAYRSIYPVEEMRIRLDGDTHSSATCACNMYLNYFEGRSGARVGTSSEAFQKKWSTHILQFACLFK